MKNGRVLITGVAGFIGSQLADKFLREKFEVIGVDDLSTGKISNIPNGVHFTKLDLSDHSQFRLLPRHCDFILHLAGQSSGEVSFDNPISDLEKNCHSTLNLIKWGISSGVKKILYASSMSVYGDGFDNPVKESNECNPKSCYGVGKLASENYLKVYQNELPFTILRMFNVYGPGQDMSNMRQGMLSIFLSQALSSGHITIKGSLDRYRDFIFIDDVVDIWYKSTFNEFTRNKIMNVGSGKKILVRDLVHKIIQLLPGTTYSTTDGTKGDQFGIYSDNFELINTFSKGHFIELNDGLAQFINYVRTISNK